MRITKGTERKNVSGDEPVYMMFHDTCWVGYINDPLGPLHLRHTNPVPPRKANVVVTEQPERFPLEDHRFLVVILSLFLFILCFFVLNIFFTTPHT